MASAGGVEMEDVSFHQCVSLSKLERDHTISFIPPDAPFTLMTYRLSTQHVLTSVNRRKKTLVTNNS